MVQVINKLVKKDHSRKTNILLGDFRIDLAFSIIATSSTRVDVTDSFTNLHETLSGRKVKNWNILQFYQSCITYYVVIVH